MRFVETQESRENTAKKQLFVYSRRAHDRQTGWYSWRVEAVEDAQAMVAYWHGVDKREYPLEQEWVVTRGERGEIVAEFTTREAVK